MAFWGVELKPKKPFTLCVGAGDDDKGGRLLVTRATLGITGPEKGKVVVEYKVDSREPIPLCILISNVRESHPLKVLFNDKEDVVFFVVGERSVHLTGFRVNGRKMHVQDGNDHNDNFIDLVDTESESDDNNDKGKENDNNFIDLVDTESESDKNDKGRENDHNDNFIDLVDTESESDSEQSENASSGDEDCGAASPPSPKTIKDMEERKKLLLAISKYPNFFGKKTIGGNTQKAFK